MCYLKLSPQAKQEILNIRLIMFAIFAPPSIGLRAYLVVSPSTSLRTGPSTSLRTGLPNRSAVKIFGGEKGKNSENLCSSVALLAFWWCGRLNKILCVLCGSDVWVQILHLGRRILRKVKSIYCKSYIKKRDRMKILHYT
jgi:hypothetical protein